MVKKLNPIRSIANKKDEFPVLKFLNSGRQVPEQNHPENMKFLIENIMKLKPQLNLLKNRIYLGKKPFSDRDLSNIRLRSREHGLSSNQEFINDVVSELGEKNSYHPFKSVVESVKWDGHDYISDLFNTIEIEHDSLENKALYFQYLKKWLVGTIAKIYAPKNQNLVLTFKGRQGIGKSRWISKLAIAEEVFSEGGIDPTNKDDILKHLNYNIFHISELDSVTSRKDAAALKDFLTKSEIGIREAYGRYDRTGTSALSFIASVNDDNFLRDVTGSRRFLVVPVKNLNADHSIEIEKVFAQAKALYDSGFQYWFSNDEVEQINAANEIFESQNKVDFFASQVKNGDSWVSIHEIFQLLDATYKYNPSDMSKLGILLKKKNVESKRQTIEGIKMTMYRIQKPTINF